MEASEFGGGRQHKESYILHISAVLLGRGTSANVNRSLVQFNPYGGAGYYLILSPVNRIPAIQEFH